MTTRKPAKRAPAKRAKARAPKAPKREKASKIIPRRRLAIPNSRQVNVALSAEEYNTLVEFSLMTGATLPESVRKSIQQTLNVTPPISAVEAREARQAQKARDREKLTT